MQVTLLAHTKLACEISDIAIMHSMRDEWDQSITDGQVVSLMAIRQCYSHKTALEVLDTEGKKYFGEKGLEGERLFNYIMSSGHTSTMEHLNFTFAVEGVSRALLAQLTRHRHFAFSVQSQRYVNFGSDARSKGFKYVKPHKLEWEDPAFHTYDEAKQIKRKNQQIKANEIFEEAMENIQTWYDLLIEAGIPQEDARAVLPNAASVNLVTTANLRAILEFYRKRKDGEGAQHEITELAEQIKNYVIDEEPWTAEFFK